MILLSFINLAKHPPQRDRRVPASQSQPLPQSNPCHPSNQLSIKKTVSLHLYYSELRSVKEQEFDLGFQEFIIKFAVNKVLQPL